ncbi:MAG TPA: hypothetical protein PK736_00735 [Bacteroidia bacterium]|nr:hypothetical protein [Bacteroidia bacterium]
MNIKSIALATMLATGIATVNAQELKGKKYVGGNFSLGVNSENEKDDKFSKDNLNFEMNVSGGYFFTNKMALGFFLKTAFSNYTNSSKTSFSDIDDKNISNQYAGGVELTKFITIKNKFSFAFKNQLVFSIMNSDYNYTSDNINGNFNSITKSTTRTFGYNFIPELHYFVSEKFSFSAQMGSAGINYGNTEEDDFNKQTFNGVMLENQSVTTKSTEFSGDVRFSLRQFSLGLVYYF